MRICVDARMIDSSGIGVYLENILPHICMSDDMDVTIYGRRERICAYPWASLRNVRVVDFGAPIYSAAEQVGLARLDKGGCDVFWSPHFNVPVLRKPGRLAVTIHDTFHLAYPGLLPGYAARVYARFMYRAAARRSDVVLTVSKFSKGEIISRTGADEAKVRVIHNGVSPVFGPGAAGRADEAREKYASGGNYLLFVGNLKPHKNPEGLLKAYSICVSEGIEEDLLVVGKSDGFMVKSRGLEETAASLGIADRVKFTGFVPAEELPGIYSAARALVIPSFYEGFGLPALEAMACGTPVVASSAASLPEVCGEAALYCDPSDPADIAAKILTIVSDDGLSRALTGKGLARAREFSFANAASGVMSALREACEG